MNDRSTVLALFVAAMILETLLVAHSGILDWFTSRSHTANDVRGLLIDWRVLLSVALVTLILWLAIRWHRLGGSGRENGPSPRDGPEQLQSMDS